jgi:hypothetical protein
MLGYGKFVVQQLHIRKDSKIVLKNCSDPFSEPEVEE